MIITIIASTKNTPETDSTDLKPLFAMILSFMLTEWNYNLWIYFTIFI
jgi:hypothetical protein